MESSIKRNKYSKKNRSTGNVSHYQNENQKILTMMIEKIVKKIQSFLEIKL